MKVYWLKLFNHLGGSQKTMFLPAETIRHIFGENFTQATFYTCDFSWTTSLPWIPQTWTIPFSLPDKM